MDSARRLATAKDQRGFALVYVALILVALCGFLGLAIDIGYMHVAKGQLQNAADSAALAGASQLPNSANARTEAVRFAATNRAAGSDVVISSNNSNSLADNNDITVGNWNRSRNPPYLEGSTPVNAVQVRSRRTDNSAGGPVDLFFSRAIGWSQMGASAIAIAQRAPKAGFYFMIGRAVCNSASFPVVLSPALNNMAWTSLLDNSTNTNDTQDNFICPSNKLPDVDVCGQSVYTTNGTANSVFQGVEVDFYDPNYDRANKTYAANGTVTTWTIIVPVSTVNDPSVQPAPQPVWGYARIVLTRACGSGNGNPCQGRPFTSPPGVCSNGESDIVINQVTCVDCANSSDMLGARPSLVR